MSNPNLAGSPLIAETSEGLTKERLSLSNVESATPKQGDGIGNEWRGTYYETYRAIDLDTNVFEIEHEGRNVLFLSQDYQNGLFLVEELGQDILKGDELAFGETDNASRSPEQKSPALARHFNRLNYYLSFYTPNKGYSPFVKLFFDVCIEMELCYGAIEKNPCLYYQEYKKTGAQIFNEIIERFRRAANSPKFQKMLKTRFSNVGKNLASATKYVDYKRDMHGSLDVLRLDVGFQDVNLGSEHTISIDTAHQHLKRLLNNHRSNKQFGKITGYFWKRESGLERGIFFHFILLVASASEEDVRALKKAFSTYWRKITGEIGVCFDCANSQNPVRRYGIGKLDHNDTEKREQLLLGLKQLFSKDFVLPDNTGGKHRAWRCGEWPRKSDIELNTPGRTGATVLSTSFAGREIAKKKGCSEMAVPRTTIALREIDAPLVVDLLIGHVTESGNPVNFQFGTNGNPHLIIVGQPGMGKTHCLINLCQQLYEQGIIPIVFSYHPDIDSKLAETVPGGIQTVCYNGLGFNPMEVLAGHHHAYLESVDRLRDVFSAIFPDLGEVQLGCLRWALKISYEDLGWSRTGGRGRTPDFGNFLDILRSQEKVDLRMLNRLEELADYGFFDAQTGSPSILDASRPTLVQIHSRQNETLQRAFATFVLYNAYTSMLKRGPQPRLTHAVIFDEAHRAAKLRLLPTMAKECRKFGISLILASQEIKDFDQSLFAAVSNSITLRMLEADAQRMAKNLGVPHDKQKHFSDQIKQMQKFRALFNREGLMEPVTMDLLA